MKTRADFQERTDPALHVDSTAGRIGDFRQNLEQRALAGAVAADEANHFARLDLEGDAVECFDDIARGGAGRRKTRPSIAMMASRIIVWPLSPS